MTARVIACGVCVCVYVHSPTRTAVLFESKLSVTVAVVGMYAYTSMESM